MPIDSELVAKEPNAALNQEIPCGGIPSFIRDAGISEFGELQKRFS